MPAPYAFASASAIWMAYFSASDALSPLLGISSSSVGRWIYFSSSRSGEFQIWKVPTAGGDAVQMTRNGGFVAFESPDGAHLYYTRTANAPSILWRLPTSGGEPVRVLEGVIQRAFVVLEKGIYYVE